MNSAENKAAVFLMGFGGPTKPEEVRPFLDSVLQGIRISPDRMAEVLSHYQAVGGASPYNSAVSKLQDALEKRLVQQEYSIPVVAGFRNSAPSFQDVFSSFKLRKIEAVVAVALSPLRSHASFGKYQERAEEARQAASAVEMHLVYTEPFYQHPSFIDAQAERIFEALKEIPFSKEKILFVYTAHSIPIEMAEKSRYLEEFEEASTLVSERVKCPHWTLAYQSRSGSPHQPWLGPDIKDILHATDSSRFDAVLIIPIGFVCENVEITYDLDIEAKKAAGEKGLRYFRAKTVSDTPRFVEMMAGLCLQKLKELELKIL